MATDYDCELNPAKLAKQKSLDSCWACGMSGTLAANMSPSQAGEDERFRKYATARTGGMPPATPGTVAADYGYLYNAFGNSAGARGIVADAFISDRLRFNGMMTVAWRVRDPAKPADVFFHTRIVWGGWS